MQLPLIFFFRSIIRLWNCLPQYIVTVNRLDAFKSITHTLHIQDVKCKQYYFCVRLLVCLYNEHVEARQNIGRRRIPSEVLLTQCQ